MRLLEIVKLLHQLGHAPEYANISDDFLSHCAAGFYSELIRRYQRYHGLEVSGDPDPLTIAHLERPRCAHPDRMELGSSSSKWGIKSLTYYQTIDYPGVPAAEIAADYAEAWHRMTAVCGLTATRALDPTKAQILAVSAPIDGPFNILAMSELPQNNAGVGTVLHQTYDIAEVSLTRAQRVAMMAHEIGHALGLDHAAPGSGNLMAPVLSSIDRPQAGDVAELVSRYGPPATQPTAPPATTPDPSPTPSPAPPVGAPTAGPDASTVLLTAGQAGDYQYRFHFPKPGVYMLVIVPLQ